MQIPAGTRLTLLVESDGEINEYSSFVLGHPEYGVCATVPQILSKEFALLVGTQLRAYFVSDDILLEFESHVMGYMATPRCMVLGDPRNLARKDRRQTNRIKVPLQVSYVQKGPQPIGDQTMTLDISAGGLSMATPVLLQRGAILTLFLRTGDKTMAMDARVVWSDWKGKNKMCGVEFLELSEEEKKELTAFVFSLERTSVSGKVAAQGPKV